MYIYIELDREALNEQGHIVLDLLWFRYVFGTQLNVHYWEINILQPIIIISKVITKFLGAVKVINYHHEWAQANMFRLRFLSLTQVGHILDSHLEICSQLRPGSSFLKISKVHLLKKVKRNPVDVKPLKNQVCLYTITKIDDLFTLIAKDLLDFEFLQFYGDERQQLTFNFFSL